MNIEGFRKHPFVNTLSRQQAEQLFACARPAHFEAGSFIFREGQAADTLYLLQDGCATLEQYVPGKGPVTVESLRAGDILGLSWFAPARWTLDARCVEAVDAFALRADCVRALIGKDPALGNELLTHLVQALYERLMRVRLQRLDVYQAGS